MFKLTSDILFCSGLVLVWLLTSLFVLQISFSDQTKLFLVFTRNDSSSGDNPQTQKKAGVLYWRELVPQKKCSQSHSSSNMNFLYLLCWCWWDDVSLDWGWDRRSQSVISSSLFSLIIFIPGNYLVTYSHCVCTTTSPPPTSYLPPPA